MVSATKLFQHNCFSDVFGLCELCNNVNLSAFILGEAVFSCGTFQGQKKNKLNETQSSRGNDQSNDVLYMVRKKKCDGNLCLKPKYCFINYLLFLFTAFILLKSNKPMSGEKFDSDLF